MTPDDDTGAPPDSSENADGTGLPGGTNRDGTSNSSKHYPTAPNRTDQTPPDASTLSRRLSGVVIVVGLFVLATVFSIGITRTVDAVVGLGDPGTMSRLLGNVLGLQVVGFGIAAVLFIWYRGVNWRSYLQLDGISEWDLLYGAAVGMSLMILTVLASLMFQFLDLETAESAVGAAEDPRFYLLLFVLSTFVAAPMEEVFFRGILQRHLADLYHPAIAIGIASLLFMLIHTGVSVGAGGELLAFGLFFSFGVVLGVSYHLTENLFVPIIGHVMFNGIQILVRMVEVMF